MALVTSPRNPPSEIEAFEADLRGLRTRAEEFLFSTRVLKWYIVMDELQDALNWLDHIQYPEGKKWQ